jgi:hypothetical protein
MLRNQVLGKLHERRVTEECAGQNFDAEVCGKPPRQARQGDGVETDFTQITVLVETIVRDVQKFAGRSSQLVENALSQGSTM